MNKLLWSDLRFMSVGCLDDGIYDKRELNNCQIQTN